MRRTVLAVVAGIFVGGLVNSALVATGHALIPPPPGLDLTNAEGWRAALPLLQPRHFVFPFLAHAIGTLAGAFLAARIAPARHRLVALIVGVVFLMGGIAAATMIPAPTWFIALDLLAAYLPMAWLASLGVSAPRSSRATDELQRSS